MTSKSNGHERGCLCATCVPNRTHAQIAEWCLAPVATAHANKSKGEDLTMSVAAAEHRICQALSDQRRKDISDALAHREHANKLAALDGTPYAPAEPA